MLSCCNKKIQQYSDLKNISVSQNSPGWICRLLGFTQSSGVPGSFWFSAIPEDFVLVYGVESKFTDLDSQLPGGERTWQNARATFGGPPANGTFYSFSESFVAWPHKLQEGLGA